MKKIFVTLLVVSAMVFALTAAALANNVYVDGVVNGKDKSESNDGTSEKNDLKSYTLGANFNLDKFLFNLEYAKETDKSNDPADSDTKYDTINFKVGYTLFGDELNYLALTAGYHQSKGDDDADQQFSGVILGISAVNNLSERTLLEGSVGYAVSGKNKYKDSGIEYKNDIDIFLLQAKYSYFFTDNFGLGIGYKYTQYKVTEGDYDGDKTTMSGPTVGLTYKF
jgi:hypothetical protein